MKSCANFFGRLRTVSRNVGKTCWDLTFGGKMHNYQTGNEAISLEFSHLGADTAVQEVQFMYQMEKACTEEETFSEIFLWFLKKRK